MGSPVRTFPKKGTKISVLGRASLDQRSSALGVGPLDRELSAQWGWGPPTSQEGCQMHLPASLPSLVSSAAIRLLLNTSQASTPAAACDLSLLALAGAGVRPHCASLPPGCTWGGLCHHPGPGRGSELCRAGRGLASVPGKLWGGPLGRSLPCCLSPICGLSGSHTW